MPQVPLPQVSDTGIQSPQYTAPMLKPLQDVVGPEIQRQGQAMSNLGQSMLAISGNINEEHAVATSNGALNEFTDIASEKDRGYHSLLGQAASHVDEKPALPFEASERVARDMEKEIDRIEQGLSSGMAKDLFRKHAEHRMVARRGRLIAHEAKQIKVHKRAEHVASATVEAREFEVTGLQENFKTAVAHVGEIATDDGLGPKAHAEAVLSAKTALHSSHVEFLLNDKEDPERSDKADKALKAIGDGEIDGKTRSALRRKIDGVMGAEKNSRAAIDLVLRGGLSVDDYAASTPAQQEKSLEVEVTRLFGVPGPWREGLSSVDVIASVPDNLVTLPLESARSRHAGQPSAERGLTWQRAMDTLESQFRSGNINAEQLIARQRGVTEQISLMLRIDSQRAKETMQQAQEAISEMAPGTSIDSDTFKAENPELFEAATDLGLLSHLRMMSSKKDDAFRKQAKAALEADFWHGITRESGRVAAMSEDQLWVKYISLGSDTYAQIRREWQRSQPEGPTEAKDISRSLLDDSVKHTLAEGGLLTGDPDSDGVPVADNDVEVQRVRRVNSDITKFLIAGGSFKEGTDDLKKFILGGVMGEQVRVPVKGYFGGVSPEMKTRFALRHTRQDAETRLAVAAQGGDADEIEDAQEALDTAEFRETTKVSRVNVNGTDVMVRSKGGLLSGIKTDDDDPLETTPVPVRQMQHLVDTERLEWMKRAFEAGRISKEDFWPVHNAMVASGTLTFDPVDADPRLRGFKRRSLHVADPDRKKINDLLSKPMVRMDDGRLALVPTPSIGEQVSLFEQHGPEMTEERRSENIAHKTSRDKRKLELQAYRRIIDDADAQAVADLMKADREKEAVAEDTAEKLRIYNAEIEKLDEKRRKSEAKRRGKNK